MDTNDRHTIDVTDESFETEVLESEQPVLVDFWAPWCGPCRMVAPILEEIARDYDGRLRVAKINTDESAERAQAYGIMGIPTLLFIAGGEELDRVVGALPRAQLEERVERFLTQAAPAVE